MKCTNCILHKTSKCNLMPGSGALDSKVMFVVEAPDELEERLNIPLAGDAGVVFNEYILPMCGLLRSSVYVTNVCKCRPPEDRKVEKDEILACKIYLTQELNYIKPKVCFLMGNIPLLALFGHENISVHRGHCFTLSKFPDTVFIPTFHPGYCLRNWEKAGIIIRDIKKGKQIADGKKPNPIKTTVTVIDKIDDLPKLQEYLNKSNRFSFDIETTGYDFTEDKILCIGFCNEPGTAFVLPFLGVYGQAIWTDVEKEYINEFMRKTFSDRTKQSIAQNGLFERLFIKKNFIKISNHTFDTMYAHHLIDENAPHNLNDLLAEYTDMPLYSEELEKEYEKCWESIVHWYPTEVKQKKIRKDYSVITPSVLHYYCGQDCDATWRVAIELERELVNSNCHDLFHNVIVGVLDVLEEIMYVGLNINVNRIHVLSAQRVEKIKQLSQELLDKIKEIHKVSVEELNVQSGPQMNAVLIEKCGWPVMKKSKKTENPSFDDESMLKYLNLEFTSKIAKIIMEIKDHRSMLSKFLSGGDGDGGILKHIASDGKVDFLQPILLFIILFVIHLILDNVILQMKIGFGLKLTTHN